ncbi:hypothetical protein FRB94_011517 [Tulasnella sp. JGI-2019a]|nr:hypothetical protein FRB94_011517 [Tulasnella sp. JGI-2019a]
MEATKDGLTILLALLKAAPIPQPFQSAVTAIPDIALQILTIIEAMKGNGEDAKALAMYIANVTEMTMRPFETKPLDNSPNMKKRIGDLHQVLETIRDELQTLTSRRLRLRVLH